jgi:hypothetical protein
MEEIGFGPTGIAWNEGSGFGLTGMSLKGGSGFWPDWYGLE